MQPIKKTYKINNDCIKQLQHCCDDHYQTCEDFSKKEQQHYKRVFDWLEGLKKTNEIVIHYVDFIPENVDIEKNIYVMFESNTITSNIIFDSVLGYFGQYEDCWNKNMSKDQLKYYGWSSKKSLLDSLKLWQVLDCGKKINKSQIQDSDINNWSHTGQLEKPMIWNTTSISK